MFIGIGSPICSVKITTYSIKNQLVIVTLRTSVTDTSGKNAPFDLLLTFFMSLPFTQARSVDYYRITLRQPGYLGPSLAAPLERERRDPGLVWLRVF